MSSAVNDITIYEKVRKFSLRSLEEYLTIQNIKDDEITSLVKNAFEQMN